MKAGGLKTFGILIGLVSIAGAGTVPEPWAYIYSQKNGLKSFLASVQSAYPKDALKGQPFDSLLRLLDRHPSSLDDGERGFLYDFLDGSDRMALALHDEKQRTKAGQNQEGFVKNLHLHALESPDPRYQRKALARLEHLQKSRSLQPADHPAIREKSKGIPWSYKFPLLHQLGLSDQDKMEILAFGNSTTVMKAAAGDSLSVQKAIQAYHKAKTLEEKSDRVEDLLLIGTPECAKAAYQDLFYPVKRSDSRVSFFPLHLRQKVLMVLRKAYPGEELFRNPLIDKPYMGQDSLAIRQYLGKVAEWGRAKYRFLPKDTLREAYIAYPVPRGVP